MNTKSLMEQKMHMIEEILNCSNLSEHDKETIKDIYKGSCFQVCFSIANDLLVDDAIISVIDEETAIKIRSESIRLERIGYIDDKLRKLYPWYTEELQKPRRRLDEILEGMKE